MSKEELEMDDMRHDAFAQMAREKNQQQQEHDKAMENPKKKAFYEQLKAKFPEMPISFR